MALDKDTIIDHIQAHPNHPIWKNVLGVYMFTDDEPAGTVEDHSPNGNDLTISAGTKTAWGGAGDTSYLQISADYGPPTTSDGAYIIDIPLRNTTNNPNREFTLLFCAEHYEESGFGGLAGVQFSKWNTSTEEYDDNAWFGDASTGSGAGNHKYRARDIAANKYCPVDPDDSNVACNEFAIASFRMDTDGADELLMRHMEALGPANIQTKTEAVNSWGSVIMNAANNGLVIGGVNVPGGETPSGNAEILGSASVSIRSRYYAVLMWERKLTYEEIVAIEYALNGVAIPGAGTNFLTMFP